MSWKKQFLENASLAFEPAKAVKEFKDEIKSKDKYIGMAQSYYDATQFEWTQEHIDDLMKFQVDNIDQNNILLLLQKGDEVLDYKDAINKFPFSQSYIEDGGSHSFDGIERYFDKIDEFIKQEYL